MIMLFCTRLEAAGNTSQSRQRNESMLRATASPVVSSQQAHDTNMASGAWDPRHITLASSSRYETFSPRLITRRFQPRSSRHS